METCEKVLDLEPKCAKAYLGKLMAELKVNVEDALCDCDNPFDDYDNYAGGQYKDVTFKDACINDIVQIRKLLSMLPKTHMDALQTLGIIVIAPEGVNSKPFIPFNDIVVKNMGKVFDDILGQYQTKRNDILANSTLKTMIRGIVFEENSELTKLKEKLLESVETKNVNMVKDCVNLIIQVQKLDYHLQRCEIKTFYDFTKVECH